MSDNHPRYLKIEEVISPDYVNCSRASWYRAIRLLGAPAPTKLGSASRWRQDLLLAWMIRHDDECQAHRVQQSKGRRRA